MTVKIPVKADLQAALADVEAEPDSPDRTDAIAKIKNQIAELPALHASLGVDSNGSPKNAA